MSISLLIAVVLAFVAGVAFAALLARSRGAAQVERRSALEQELAAVKADSALKQAEIAALLSAKAGLEATLAAERESTREKVQLLSETGVKLENTFKAMASSALQNNNANFLELARSTLQNYQSEAKSELEAREKAVERLVKPITDSLKQVGEKGGELGKEPHRAFLPPPPQGGSPARPEKALQTETGNLVKALREPQARGRWG